MIAAHASRASSSLRRVVTRLWSRRRVVVLRAELSALRADLGGLQSSLTRVGGEIDGMRSGLQTSIERTEEVGGRMEWISTVMEQDREGVRRAISDLSRRVPDAVPLYGSEAFTLERFDAGLGGEVVGFRDSGSDAETRVYLGFEDFFRGTEELIRERQLAYMPLLDARSPVLDIGCGRGEMVELLRARGVEVEGIDIDPAMVEHCRAKGLERVQVANAVDYLEATEAGSLGAVFAGQVIEHLPYPSLLPFLRAARKTLAPGGLLVVETVNPHAPQALKHFWIDPTHQHPLYPEVVVALCRLTGFASAYVWHPQGSGDPDRDRTEQSDYAVVAEAPAPAPDGSKPS